MGTDSENRFKVSHTKIGQNWTNLVRISQYFEAYLCLIDVTLCNYAQLLPPILTTHQIDQLLYISFVKVFEGGGMEEFCGGFKLFLF